MWLSTPFWVVEPGDLYFAQTVRVIETRLGLEGGIRRYPTDTYFGSGAWPVLTASLGWHYAESGNIDAARRCGDWVAARFDNEGRLGEQFGGERRDPEHYREWVELWGPPARDLTWSHAMYVVLCAALDKPSESYSGSPPTHTSGNHGKASR